MRGLPLVERKRNMMDDSPEIHVYKLLMMLRKERHHYRQELEVGGPLILGNPKKERAKMILDATEWIEDKLALALHSFLPSSSKQEPVPDFNAKNEIANLCSRVTDLESRCSNLVYGNENLRKDIDTLHKITQEHLETLALHLERIRSLERCRDNHNEGCSKFYAIIRDAFTSWSESASRRPEHNNLRAVADTLGIILEANARSKVSHD